MLFSKIQTNPHRYQGDVHDDDEDYYYYYYYFNPAAVCMLGLFLLATNRSRGYMECG